MTLIRKPLPRTRATPRAWKTPRCIGWVTDPAKTSRCRLPQKHIERCKPHADRYLDGLVRDILRGIPCQIPHRNLFPCSGAIQVNHGLDRDEKSVRWNLRNVIPGCAAVNVWAFHHKRQWYGMFAAMIGLEAFAQLTAIADDPPKLDYEAIRAELTAALKNAKGAA